MPPWLASIPTIMPCWSFLTMSLRMSSVLRDAQLFALTSLNTVTKPCAASCWTTAQLASSSPATDPENGGRAR